MCECVSEAVPTRKQLKKVTIHENKATFEQIWTDIQCIWIKYIMSPVLSLSWKFSHNNASGPHILAYICMWNVCRWNRWWSMYKLLALVQKMSVVKSMQLYEVFLTNSASLCHVLVKNCQISISVQSQKSSIGYNLGYNLQ